MGTNEICAALMICRVYLLFKVFRHFSKWTSHEAQEACLIYETRATASFAVKAILKEKPFHLLIPLILISIIAFSASVRLFERDFVLSSSQQDYSYIWNAMWMVMLTMTTVGYGDFFPRTHFGRFVAVLACIWGIFLISLMVVTLTNFLLFSNEESRSFHYINRVKSLEDSKKFARLYIKAQLERFLYYRRAKKDANFRVYVDNLNLVIKYHFKKFKEAQRQAKFADIEAAEMLTVLNERISVQVNVIKRNLNHALKVHDNMTVALASQNKTKYCLESSITHLKDLQKLVY
jgi:potassium intermediate/small conductance calcium-activated channel subfamily N protein 2